MHRATGKSFFISLAAVALTAWAAPELRAQNLRGEYWENATIPATPGVPPAPDTVDHTSNDAAIDFDDTAGSGAPDFPVPLASLDNFVVRWTGFVMGPVNGPVTFTTLSDDGVQLTVGGTVLFTNWDDHGPETDNGTFTMQQGIWYPIQLLFYERGVTCRIRLSWSYAGQADQLIPPANLAQTVPTPAAPVLSGTAGDLQATFNTLNWTFTGTASNFTIYRSTDIAQQGPVLTTVGGNVLTYTDMGANQYNTTYYYRVTATNGVEGPVSNQVALTPQPPPPRTKDHSEGFIDDNCACGSSAGGAAPWAAVVAAGLLGAALLRRATA